MGSLVTLLLQIFFSDSHSEKKFKNWSIFDEVIRRTKSVSNFVSHPVYTVSQKTRHPTHVDNFAKC